MKGLYAIVDPEHCAGRDPVWVAQEIVRGGAAALQLRAKRLDDAQYVALGRQLRALCRTAGVPFFVNDRLHLVRALDADGVHLGQTDLPIEQAHRLLGRDALVGLSTHDLAQARDAAMRGADLIGFGPVFATVSKDRPSPVVGLEGLRAVCRAVQLPVVAIGGIDLDCVGSVAATGAPLWAAIGALCKAPDPATAAARMHAFANVETPR